MLNLMLENELLKALGSMPVMMGIILAALGIALAILSKRVARAVRKTNEIEEDDKIVLGIRVVGLVFALVALILVAYGSNLVL